MFCLVCDTWQLRKSSSASIRRLKVVVKWFINSDPKEIVGEAWFKYKDESGIPLTMGIADISECQNSIVPASSVLGKAICQRQVFSTVPGTAWLPSEGQGQWLVLLSTGWPRGPGLRAEEIRLPRGEKPQVGQGDRSRDWARPSLS